MNKIPKELIERCAEGTTKKQHQEMGKFQGTPNIDYDLFVINPNNPDSTHEQIRDCIYDALKTLDERTK